LTPRKVAWFVALWAGGVGVLGLAALAIRAALGL
jgi:hypothetical protein